MMRVVRASLTDRPRRKSSMLQRALPVRHPPIAPGERLGSRGQLDARTLFRAFVDHSLRLLRLLGEFFAAGGALS